MPSISLKVPTIVREVKADEQRFFYIRPLFINYPLVTNHRYEKGLSAYKRELKQYFRNYELSRANLDYLLWYMFPMEANYELIEVQFRLDGVEVKGLIGVAVVCHQAYTFVAFPFLHNFMFMARNTPADKHAFRQEVSVVTKKLFGKLKKNDPQNFVVEDFLSTRKEFITSIEQAVQIRPAKFSFEQSGMSDLFSAMHASSEFIGSVEIEKVGQGLNYLHPEELARAYYRDKEVDFLFETLFKAESKAALAIVGEIGSGRHTILEETIWRHMDRKHHQRKEQVWLINPNRVIAGMSIVGMWQKRFESILEYAKMPVEDNKAISDTVVFDNPVALLRIGKTSQNSMTLSSLLKSYLENRNLQVLLIATPEEWKVVQEKDRRFADLFQVMRLQAPDFATAAKMVLHQRREVERSNNCQFSIQAVLQLFNIHRVYLKKEVLPGGVMKLMKQLAAKYRGRNIDLNTIRKEFKSTFGLEDRIFENDYTFEKDEVKKALAAQLVGQAQAVDAIAKSIHLVKAKLANPQRPLSSFLFIGPTGVGKTQAAKVLCKYLMGDDKHLLRFDMNEYVDGLAIQRLIGDEYQPEGILTGKVRYRSFGVILLDEIEKANPAVHDLLLQVLDDGRLTDSRGRVVDFSNFIIIMTSNIGAQEVDRQISIGQEHSTAAIYRKAVERYFRPEFVNRIDEIVVFNPLQREHILDIARLQINDLLQRDGFLRRTTILNISQDTLLWIAKRGYNQKMGGRALKRQIEKDLTTVSAKQLMNIQSDSPIIFDIKFDPKQEQLQSEINPLRLRFRQPKDYWTPPFKTTRNVYNDLFHRIQQLEDRLRHFQDEGVMDEEDNWQFYQLTNTLTELKENITFTNLRSGIASAPYNAAISLKRLKRFSRAKNTSARDILYDIRENYRHNQMLIERAHAPIAHFAAEVLLLELGCQHYFEVGEDHVLFQIQSCAKGYGEYECQFLMEHYEQLFKALDWGYQKLDNAFRIQAHAALPLLQAETGIHLFYTNYNMPIPIQISANEHTSNDVIRVYDSGDTMTDLRSHYIVHLDFTAQEFKLILLGGLMKEEI
ncbi:MAG: AAA family ATPase [Bacteroidota bacterium]